MIPDGFVEFLVDDMQESGSTDWVDTLLAGAKTKIEAGSGEVVQVISGTINGKTVQRQIEITATEMAMACRLALKRYTGTATPITYAAFSQLRR